MFFTPAVPYVVPTKMIDVISHLGLQSGLKLCLDAGDIDSYDGSSQTWVDRSGGAYSVYRGSGSGADGGDPTFSGVAGRQSASEYWTFDGTADHFTLNQANPSWVENLHKNSAKWAFASWLYVGSVPATAAVFFGTNGSGGTQVGVSVFLRSTGALRVTVTNGTSTVLLLTSTATVSTNAWNYLALEIDEAAGTGSLTVNATQEDQVTTYVSPSAGSADHQLQVGHDGVGAPSAGYIPSGYRLPNIQIWESTIPTKAQLLSLQSVTSAKFA